MNSKSKQAGWWFLAAFAVSAFAQQPPDERARLTGNWTGESICVNREKFPACKDEQVIYRLVPARDKANIINITMDKLVAGKPETMGDSDFTYDRQRGTLVSEYTYNKNHLLWEFTVKGAVMEGTLTALPEKTLVRRIKVTKDTR